MAAPRGVSVDKLMVELSLRALTEQDAEMRFQSRAARGKVEDGLAVVDKLDRMHSRAEDP